MKPIEYLSMFLELILTLNGTKLRIDNLIVGCYLRLPD